MYAHRELSVKLGLDATCALLADPDWGWFDLSQTQEKHAFLTGSIAGVAELHREAVVHRGAAVLSGEGCSVPVRLDAEQRPEWFPTFAGVLTAASAGRYAVLALEGEYVVPAGSAGQLIDRVLLHTLAESSLQSFLSQVEGSLRSAVRSGAKSR